MYSLPWMGGHTHIHAHSSDRQHSSVGGHSMAPLNMMVNTLLITVLSIKVVHKMLHRITFTIAHVCVFVCMCMCVVNYIHNASRGK